MSSQPVNPGTLCDAQPRAVASRSFSFSSQGRRALAFLKSIVDRLLHLATWSRSVRFVSYRKALWQRRTLDRALRNAQIALGRRMFEAGIDDGELGAQIDLLNRKLRQANAARTLTGELERELHQLFVQLAAAALAEEGPLPGAEIEYARARAIQAALQE